MDSVQARLSVALTAMALCGSCRPTSEQSITIIPSEFQGRWSDSIEACNSSESARDSYYVTNQSVGGFEHLYSFSELKREGQSLSFVSMAGGQTKLELIKDGEMRATFDQEAAVLMVRCSSDADG